MTKPFLFADFIAEFRVTFTAYTEQPGAWADNGEWVPGEATPVQVDGIILPLTEDDLRYAPNGVFTVRDRKIYTTTPLSIGQKIEYQGQQYTIQNERPYSDYADVFIYYARGVDME